MNSGYVIVSKEKITKTCVYIINEIDRIRKEKYNNYVHTIIESSFRKINWQEGNNKASKKLEKMSEYDRDKILNPYKSGLALSQKLLKAAMFSDGDTIMLSINEAEWLYNNYVDMEKKGK